jgi:2-amino-4-hydroxy-6-hydroxymethyldihydropteridine diphosphokinase
LLSIYLGLGSNLGNKKDNIEKAILRINGHPEINIVKQAKIIETKPEGKLDQPDFLNTVIEIETELEPKELLEELQKIEEELGRVRVEKWGPRIIDIDILLYNNLTIEQEGLTIPHPLVQEREFVLRSLLELCPDLKHPVLHKSFREMHDALIKVKES